MKKNPNHFIRRSYRGEHKSTSLKKKVVTLDVIKKVLYAGSKLVRNILTNLSPSPARPNPKTYNSVLCQKFHSNTSTCATTQKYI